MSGTKGIFLFLLLLLPGCESGDRHPPKLDFSPRGLVLLRTKGPAIPALAPGNGPNEINLLTGPDLTIHPGRRRARGLVFGPGKKLNRQGIPLAGDLDGDGRREFYTVTGKGTILCLASAREIRSPDGIPFRVVTGSRPVLADFDGDGRVDLLGFAPGKMGLHLWSDLTGQAKPQACRVSFRPGPRSTLRATGRGRYLLANPPPGPFLCAVKVKRPEPGLWAPELILWRGQDSLSLALRVEIGRGFLDRQEYCFSLVDKSPQGESTLLKTTHGRPDGDWHRLSAIYTNREITIWWDSTKLGTVYCKLFPTGYPVGLGNGPGTAYFSDFELADFMPSSQARSKVTSDLFSPLPGTSTGHWERAPDNSYPAIRNCPVRAGLSLEAIDFDGDGDPDLIMGLPGFPLRWSENLGDAIFASPLPLRGTNGRPLIVDGLSECPAALPRQGGGRPDLLVGTKDGAIRLLRGEFIDLPGK